MARATIGIVAARIQRRDAGARHVRAVAATPPAPVLAPLRRRCLVCSVGRCGTRFVDGTEAALDRARPLPETGRHHHGRDTHRPAAPQASSTSSRSRWYRPTQGRYQDVRGPGTQRSSSRSLGSSRTRPPSTSGSAFTGAHVRLRPSVRWSFAPRTAEGDPCRAGSAPPRRSRLIAHARRFARPLARP